jgi:hypothetical protein
MATVGGSQDALNAGDDVKAIEACVPCIWKQGNIYNMLKRELKKIWANFHLESCKIAMVTFLFMVGLFLFI